MEEDDPYGVSPAAARSTPTRVARSPAAAAPTAYTAAPGPARPRSPVPAHDAAYEPLSLAAPGPSNEPIY